MKKLTTKNIALSAVMIALSIALSYVPIPSPTGTVSLDATPGYVSGVVLQPFLGGIIGFVGHIVVSLKTGFPLGIFHLYIGLTMFLSCYAFGYLYKKNIYLASLTAYLLNVIVGLFPFLFLFGIGFIISMLIPLSIGAIINIFIAAVIPKYFYKNK